ncbi:MAG: primosomal protein DnaI [Candidatus Izemoplasmatales bacterium]|jgi:primosomal protein DnaI
MKKINDYLLDKSSKYSPDEIIDRLLEDAIINRFVLTNDLKHDTITDGINQLLTFKESKDTCNQCQGLYECKLNYLGMQPRLVMYDSEIALDYGKCRYNTSDESRSKIDAMYVPRKVFNADFSDFDLIGSSRKEIQKYMLEFLHDYSKTNPKKGLYLSGLFGSGKTYILAAMANELAKKNFNIIFAYYPDLVRELKSSIGTGELEEKIQRLKTVDVLFLDDIGGETNSAFIRDEVLGPILQHRVLDELPTFFSSNIKMRSLIEAMQIDASSHEKTKAVRIYERIHELAIEFELTEKPIR